MPRCLPFARLSAALNLDFVRTSEGETAVYLRLLFETTTVLALALTRWFVCCQMSWFCLLPRETLERVKQRQLAGRLSIFGSHLAEA